ncbi:hypothetical protein SEA_LILBEANIE_78 [Gordonia phage Lilbeanie]|uniref:Uncharacterized protein n=1 Tax=Gordonia phage Lilbeanie TaxID=2794947 RepID=A0A7T1KSB7_9CAUD|nr:hypothetical protein J1773_gp78 [Gordonia phage Lilbeanie]QPO17156.1 hypothetical protein SEA_LILBEANIE_78 [Gordonia phage Lilbeanie]
MGDLVLASLSEGSTSIVPHQPCGAFRYDRTTRTGHMCVLTAGHDGGHYDPRFRNMPHANWGLMVSAYRWEGRDPDYHGDGFHRPEFIRARGDRALRVADGGLWPDEPVTITQWVQAFIGLR